MSQFEVNNENHPEDYKHTAEIRMATIAVGAACVSIVLTDTAIRSKAFEIMFRIGEFAYI